MPAVADLVHAGHGVSARRLELDELLDLAADPPAEIEPGGTALVVLAVLDVARRSVAAGLVHPHLQAADGRWHALWGATLDEHVLDELHALAHAAPAAAADAFDGDTRAFVDDLYACAVDELARRAMRHAGVTFPTATARAAGATERFLAGLAASSPELPAEAGYAALERRVAAWVDGGLARRSRAPWNLGLRLDEGAAQAVGDAPPVVLELWLEAADDPTLALPAALLETGADEVFGFLRDSDPRRALDRRLETIEPVLADAGIALEGDPPTHVALDADQVRAFLRDAMPRLEALGVPLRLPRDWVSSSSRVRVNLVATGSTAVSSGLLTRDAIASFDWRVAIGDVELSEEELRELAAAKEPLIRLRGKWHALRASEVERALRFLERRGRSAGVIELVRAVSGLETDEAGVELGEVRLDATLDDLLAGADERRFQPRATPAGHAPRPVPLPGARPRVAAAARRPARRRDPRRRHGAREDGPGDRDPRLGARGRRRGRRADARRQPDERLAAVGAGDRPLRSRPARPPPPRAVAPPGDAFVATAGRERRRRHVVRRRDAGRRAALAVRVGPAAPRRGAGREEPADEAASCAAADPAAARARAHGHADREPARRAVGDHGPRQPRVAGLARGVRALVRPPDRGAARRAGARAAALARRPVRPPQGQGRPRGRSRAPADHDREGGVQPDRRAGEPLPRHGRPLDAAHRARTRRRSTGAGRSSRCSGS